MLCICHTTPTQKLFCLHVFRQIGPPQRVDCLAPKWETALSVFTKDTATRYRIGSRTSFRLLAAPLPTEPRRRLGICEGWLKTSYGVVEG